MLFEETLEAEALRAQLAEAARHSAEKLRQSQKLPIDSRAIDLLDRALGGFPGAYRRRATAFNVLLGPSDAGSSIAGTRGFADLESLRESDQLTEADRESRARFYVGATRAQILLVVTGHGTPEGLFAEALDALRRLPELQPGIE